MAAATERAKDLAADRAGELATAARQDDPRHWRALLACVLAVVATAIDPPILQATSSGMQGALRVAPDTAAAMIGIYYVIQAGAMVLGGILGDRFGMRRVLLAGLVGLLGSSVLVAFAPTPTLLIAGHVLLSLATAVVLPLSLANVMGTFDRRVMPVAIAVYLTVQLLASLSGPAMAQFLFDRAGFAAVLAPAILATVAAIVAVARWVPESTLAGRLRGLDAVAIFLWSLGMLAVVYGLVAVAGGWGSLRVLALLVGAGLLLAAVLRFARTRTTGLPEVPFRIVGVTLFVGAVLGLAQSGSLLQLSTYLKGVQDVGDVASGIALAPYALGTLIASIATGIALARRFRDATLDVAAFRRPIATGLLLVGVALLLFGAIEADTGYLLVGVALGVLGVGASIANVPRTDLLFRSVRPDRIGVAAGLNGSSFLLGEAMGNVAVTAMISLTSAEAWQQQLVAGGATPDAAAATYDQVIQAMVLTTAHPFLQPSFLDVASQVPGWDQVFTDAFTAAMVVLAGIALFAAVVAVLGIRSASVAARPPRSSPSGAAA